MLQGLEKARAATQALAVLPVRVAADGSVVIVQVGAEGGDLTLIGREGSEGGWQFARVTNDQSEALFGEVDVPDHGAGSHVARVGRQLGGRVTAPGSVSVGAAASGVRASGVRRAGEGGGGGAAGGRGPRRCGAGAGEVGAVVQRYVGRWIGRRPARERIMNDDQRKQAHGFLTGLEGRLRTTLKEAERRDGMSVAKQIEAISLRAREETAKRHLKSPEAAFLNTGSRLR